MKISVKARYGLGALVSMAMDFAPDEYVTVASLSETLNLSKIYLEQVFSLLKRGGLVTSTKGPQGGYQFAKAPGDITAYDILSAIELPLFEPTEQTVAEAREPIEKAMQETVFTPLDRVILESLKGITLETICDEAMKHDDHTSYMYYL